MKRRKITETDAIIAIYAFELFVSGPAENVIVLLFKRLLICQINNEIMHLLLTLILNIDSPVSPGRPSSGVVGECELPHPVHGGDGVVPPVPPPPGKDASHPGGLQAVQHLNIHLQTTHCRHCRQMY